jgi:hypothetical protein
MISACLRSPGVRIVSATTSLSALTGLWPTKPWAATSSGSSGLDWSPHRGYLLAAGDRLIVLATRNGLGRFLSVH